MSSHPHNAGNQPVGSTQYLINTSKAMRGVKLKTKDFIRLQLLKFRRCSPVKYTQIVEEALSKPSKTSDYIKFKPFETIEQEKIQDIIANQRKQMSRQNKGRPKIFSNPKINSMFFDQSMTLAQGSLQVRRKPATSQQPRINDKRNYPNFKTISHTSYALGGQKKVEKEQPMFHSDNLGSKMNQFLNAYLYHQEEAKQNSKQPLKQQTQSSKIQEDYAVFYDNQQGFKKKGNSLFVRQMKKNKREKVEESITDLFPQFKSEELAKHFSADISHRQRTSKTQNKPRTHINYQQINNKFNEYQVSVQGRNSSGSGTDRQFKISKK